MKKLTLILTIVFSATSLFAANRFSIEESSVTASDTGKFYIVMQNDARVNGLNIIIQFDPSLITPLNIRPLERAALQSGSAGYRFAEDKISFIIYDQSASQINIGEGKMFEVEYVATDSLIADTTTTQVAFYQGLAADSTIAPITFDYVNGTITIYPNPSTGVEHQPQQPVQFELSHNYPNPFNPNTTIKYAIPVASTVSLRIYDILGREVRSLVNEAQDTGYKTVVWDAKNNAGMPVATGVYFYRIEATSIGSQHPSFVQAKRMLLLK